MAASLFDQIMQILNADPSVAGNAQVQEAVRQATAGMQGAQPATASQATAAPVVSSPSLANTGGAVANAPTGPTSAAQGWSQGPQVRQSKRNQNALFAALKSPNTPGYDAYDQAQAYVAAGAPQISKTFAQGVASRDPATEAFIDMVRRRQGMASPAGTPANYGGLY